MEKPCEILCESCEYYRCNVEDEEPEYQCCFDAFQDEGYVYCAHCYDCECCKED